MLANSDNEMFFLSFIRSILLTLLKVLPAQVI
jgi:hypothetical protein